MNLGEKASFSKTISESDVYLFAGITGDFNPIHIDNITAGVASHIPESPMAH